MAKFVLTIFSARKELGLGGSRLSGLGMAIWWKLRWRESEHA